MKVRSYNLVLGYHTYDVSNGSVEAQYIDVVFCGKYLEIFDSLL